MIRYFVKSLLLTIFGGYILLSSPLLSAEDLSPEAIEATKNIASGQDNPNPAAGNIQTEQNLVEQAVIAFKNREDLDQAQKGIQLYGQLLEQNRDKILYWNRLLRLYWWYGSHLPKNDPNKVIVFKKGLSKAQEMVRLIPREPFAHMWVGVLLSSWAMEKGLINVLTKLSAIRKNFEKAVSLDPKFSWGHRLIGRCYRDAPGWPLSYGDMDKAFAYFSKAREFNPQDLRIYLDMAIAYHKIKKWAEAKKWAKKALDMPIITDSDIAAEHREAKEHAKEIFNILKSK